MSNKQISIMDRLEEQEMENLLAGETVCCTQNGAKRHIQSKLAPSMTYCGYYLAGFSKANPTDKDVPFCKECIGHLRTQAVMREKMS